MIEEFSFVTLEDGRECIILDEFIYQEQPYVLLINSKNKNDYIIRKVVEDELVGLIDENEFNNVLNFYFNLEKGAK